MSAMERLAEAQYDREPDHFPDDSWEAFWEESDRCRED